MLVYCLLFLAFFFLLAGMHVITFKDLQRKLQTAAKTSTKACKQSWSRRMSTPYLFGNTRSFLQYRGYTAQLFKMRFVSKGTQPLTIMRY